MIPANSQMVFECQDISLDYEIGKTEMPALRNINLNIERGMFACLSGPSGSGKSTLLNVLGLIEPLQQGHLIFEGRDLRTLSEAEKNKIRRFNVGFVFQNFNLIQVGVATI